MKMQTTRNGAGLGAPQLRLFKIPYSAAALADASFPADNVARDFASCSESGDGDLLGMDARCSPKGVQVAYHSPVLTTIKQGARSAREIHPGEGNDAMTEQKGGCLCGNIRYTLKSAPVATVVCHCTHCQKVSGSAFSTNIVLPRADIEFSGGQLAAYDDTAESGNILVRSFCPKCGSSLMSESPARPGVAILKAGTLDDTTSVKPAAQIWTRSAQPWVSLGGELASFEKAR